MWTTIIRIAALKGPDTRYKNAFTEQSTLIHEDVLETLSCLKFQLEIEFDLFDVDIKLINNANVCF
jgi:hypothetical protein